MSAQVDRGVLMLSMVSRPADTKTAVRLAHSLQHDLLTKVQLLALIYRSIGSIAQSPALEERQRAVFAVPAVFIKNASQLRQNAIFAVPAVFIKHTRIWRTPNLRSTIHSTHGIIGSPLREIDTSSATCREG